MKKVVFFAGVPLNDSALRYRVMPVAHTLIKSGYKVTTTNVSINFRLQRQIIIDGLKVKILGQAHYKSRRPFSGRERLKPSENLLSLLGLCRQSFAFLHHEKPDIVQVFYSYPPSILFALVAKILGLKVFWDIDDLGWAQAQAAGYPKVIVILWRWLEKKAPSFLADRITVCSHYLKGVYPRADIVPNCVDTKSFLGSINSVSLRKKYDLKKIVVVFQGTIGPYHGQIEILKSFSKFLRKRNDVTLLFVGGGEVEAKLRQTIQAEGLDDKVKVTGYLPQKSVFALLRVSHIGLMPLADTSLCRARFPLKLVEYMAAGLPVVCHRVGEAKRMLRHCQTAWLVDPSDPASMLSGVRYLIAHPQKRKSIAQKGKKVALKYDQARITHLWHLLYRQNET